MSDNKQELQKQAEELGVKVDSRWGEDRLSAEIDKALDADPALDSDQGEGGQSTVAQEKPKRSKPDVYKNVTNGVVYVCGHRVQSGMSHEITDVDKKNAIGKKRLEHAVKLGMVEKV